MIEDSQQVPSPAPEVIQEAGYRFPYHYVPRLTDAGFVQSVTLRWGYLYWSYLGVVLGCIEKLQPKSLLDVGSGDGRLVAEVTARLPRTRAVGVDTSERAVALARAMTPGAEFRAGDVTAPGFLDQRFDAITMVEVLEHIPIQQIATLRATLRNHLESRGRLIVTVPTKNLGMHPKHYQHFDIESLIAALEPDFALEDASYLNRHSKLCKLFDRILTNRFFAVREPRLLAWFFHVYKRRFLYADPSSAMRILAVFKAA
ncbi:MAG: class I SAM-dependent methyltransferase [bacterium]|nr:class I SAM-dependent methyltransferase [bacterium]